MDSVITFSLKEIPIFRDLVVDTIRESIPSQKISFFEAATFWFRHSFTSKKSLINRVKNNVPLSAPEIAHLPEGKIVALASLLKQQSQLSHEAISACPCDKKAALLSSMLSDEEFLKKSIDYALKLNMALVNRQEDDMRIEKITYFVDKLKKLTSHATSIINRRALFTYFREVHIGVEAPLNSYFNTELLIWNCFATSCLYPLEEEVLTRVFTRHVAHQIHEAKRSFSALNYEYEEEALTHYIKQRINASINHEFSFFLGFSLHNGNHAAVVSRWKALFKGLPWLIIDDL